MSGSRRFRFVPLHPNAVIAHGPDRAIVGRAGDEVDIPDVLLDPGAGPGSETYSEYLIRAVPGAGGGQCLVPPDAPLLDQPPAKPDTPVYATTAQVAPPLVDEGPDDGEDEVEIPEWRGLHYAKLKAICSRVPGGDGLRKKAPIMDHLEQVAVTAPAAFMAAFDEVMN